MGPIQINGHQVKPLERHERLRCGAKAWEVWKPSGSHSADQMIAAKGVGLVRRFRTRSQPDHAIASCPQVGANEPRLLHAGEAVDGGAHARTPLPAATMYLRFQKVHEGWLSPASTAVLLLLPCLLLRELQALREALLIAALVNAHKHRSHHDRTARCRAGAARCARRRRRTLAHV
jgi:hypothetical protein